MRLKVKMQQPRRDRRRRLQERCTLEATVTVSRAAAAVLAVALVEEGAAVALDGLPSVAVVTVTLSAVAMEAAGLSTWGLTFCLDTMT